MTNTPSFVEVQQMRAEAARLAEEAAADRKAAAEDRAAAEYERGQAEHRLRTVMATERGIAEREQKLKELGEPQLVAREKAADAKLAEAKALMADYDAAKHGAAININKWIEHDRAELAAAGIEY
jgi:hypothetical protein